MASTTKKRAWKLQEFVAHGGSVNCLALGHKSGRVMVTGGDDRKVNMWAVGKPNCVMSLSGHTSPIEAVRFGTAEEMVAAGSLSGALKIWDLEAAKIMRTLTGHKAAIKSLDFHPFGDFVASGSEDSNIKLWDIRRKGCIFTYKDHTKCINSLRFSPDGRWIASAGEDGLLKIWDLTAGKLLTNLARHSEPITSAEFHPNEFLLATAGLDRVVKFWDLETFEMVSSTDGNSPGIRSIVFHPDGLCLYAAAQDVLNVYGWEPSQHLDSINMNWGKINDIAIAANQLIGVAYSQTNISTFVADIQRIQPLGGDPMKTQLLSPPRSASQSEVNGLLQSHCSGRRSFVVDRPATQSTKQKPADTPKEEPEEQPSPPDDGADDQSYADIVDQDNYREVFQPRTKRLDRSPSRQVEPFPAPQDDDPPAPQSKSDTVVLPQPAVSVAPPSNAAATRVTSSAAKPAPKVSTSAASKPKNVAESSSEPTPVAPSNRNQPVDLNMDDFLPKQQQPSINRQSTPANISEQETLSSIIKGHDYMNKVLTSRQKNLQIVRALWTSGNTKTAVDSALSMNDLPVIVDLVNVLNQRPGLWSLDLCAALLPQIPDLLSSKYHNYGECGCSAIKIIVRNFGSLIKSNMTAPPSIGVDISREERYQKCKECYKILMNIRSSLDQKPVDGRLAPQVRELQLLMSQLD